MTLTDALLLVIAITALAQLSLASRLQRLINRLLRDRDP